MTSFQENLENLERVFELFNANNSHGHIVISLSPVPLRATFRNLNAVTANTASKSMLQIDIYGVTFKISNPDILIDMNIVQLQL